MSERGNTSRPAGRGGAEDGDRIAALLRIAGPRPEVPAERSARVREAVRAHWQAEVGRRTVRRRWAGGAMAAAALLIAAVGVGALRRGGETPSHSVTAGSVESVAGSAWLRAAAGPEEESSEILRAGALLTAGSEIATGGGGRVALRLGSGHSVRLDTESRLRVVSDSVVALDRGALYVDSGPARPAASARRLAIHTDLGLVHDIGTQFEVRLQGAGLRIRVREGEVLLEGDDGAHSVLAGSEMEMRAGGEPVWRTVSSHARAWDWVGQITPPMAIEGLSVQSFLEWMARERGWSLEYDDPELAASAPEILLNGSIEGLGLDEALAAVLPTCRMTHRVENGVLRIGALGGEGERG